MLPNILGLNEVPWSLKRLGNNLSGKKKAKEKKGKMEKLISANLEIKAKIIKLEWGRSFYANKKNS